jgi:hypothetical protein
VRKVDFKRNRIRQIGTFVPMLLRPAPLLSRLLRSVSRDSKLQPAVPCTRPKRLLPSLPLRFPVEQRLAHNSRAPLNPNSSGIIQVLRTHHV